MTFLHKDLQDVINFAKGGNLTEANKILIFHWDRFKKIGPKILQDLNRVRIALETYQKSIEFGLDKDVNTMMAEAGGALNQLNYIKQELKRLSEEVNKL